MLLIRVAHQLSGTTRRPGVKTTSCHGEIVRSPAPPGVPELKLHSIMIK